MYQLKKGQEAFTVVEGPFAGRSFKPGQSYGEIPPGAEGKFESGDMMPHRVPTPPAPDPEAAKPARSAGKRGPGDAPESGEVKS